MIKITLKPATIRRCKECGADKPLNEFNSKGNKGPKKYYDTRCRQCKLAADKAWRADNREKLKQRNIRSELRHPKRKWCGRCISNHKKSGHTAAITAEELLVLAQPVSHCPICGIELAWGRAVSKQEEQAGNRPSADRTDNTKILSKDNIMIMCKRCNATKLDRTFQEFIDYCRNVVAKFG